MHAHAAAFVADVIDRSRSSRPLHVFEMASHGGYLGGYFQERGIETLVFDPEASVIRSGARTGPSGPPNHPPRPSAVDLASRGPADLIVDNYRLAHLRDPGGALDAIAALLDPDGMAVVEFDHVLPVLMGTQFDAFRHGHFSYLSLLALERGLADHGLAAIDAVAYPVYGGALRVFIRHARAARPPTRRLEEIRDAERSAGLDHLGVYESFAGSVARVTAGLLRFLRDERSTGHMVAGYGAPSRANTLLNTCGITSELLAFTVDRAEAKQGRYLPGSRIEISPPDRLRQARPDDVLILPWDLADEITAQLADLRQLGTKFVVPIPNLVVLD